MNIQELRKKNTKELEKELLKLLREKFNLRMQMAKRALPQTHLLKQVRRTIARVKTLLTEQYNIMNN